MKYLLAILLLSCSILKSPKLLVRNNSNLDFDSIRVSVCSQSYLFKNVIPGSEVSSSIEVNSSIACKDVVFFATFYKKDSIVAKKSHYSNDLNYMPVETIITIDSSLNIIINELVE